MRYLTLNFAIWALALGMVGSALVHCSSPQAKNDTKQKTVLDETKPTAPASDQEFEKLPEGFINPNTFQVVVSSLKSSPKDAESEAVMVAQKKAFQMLQTYPKNALTIEGRKELKEISESGKIVRKSPPSTRTYFVYQIQKTGLELQIRSKLH